MMLRGKSTVVATILAFAGLPLQGCRGLATPPRRMPPMPAQAKPEQHDDLSRAAYGPKRNHPTAYDESPPFKGPLALAKASSPDLHRQRIRRYYNDTNLRDFRRRRPPSEYSKQWWITWRILIARSTPRRWPRASSSIIEPPSVCWELPRG